MQDETIASLFMEHERYWNDEILATRFIPYDTEAIKKIPISSQMVSDKLI